MRSPVRLERVLGMCLFVELGDRCLVCSDFRTGIVSFCEGAIAWFARKLETRSVSTFHVRAKVQTR